MAVSCRAKAIIAGVNSFCFIIKAIGCILAILMNNDQIFKVYCVFAPQRFQDLN